MKKTDNFNISIEPYGLTLDCLIKKGLAKERIVSDQKAIRDNASQLINYMALQMITDYGICLAHVIGSERCKKIYTRSVKETSHYYFITRHIKKFTQLSDEELSYAVNTYKILDNKLPGDAKEICIGISKYKKHIILGAL